MSNIAKTAILETFRRITWPYRRVASSHYSHRQQTPVILVYYHRVADTRPVAWSLTNAQFKAHIDWLQSQYQMVSIAEAQRRIVEGNDQPVVHVTFDDGYAENCDQALPLLIDRGIPCTYFVTLDNVANARPFGHDQKLGCDFPANTIAELRDLAEQGIEIGAHTRTHPNMGQVQDLETIYDEIVLAKQELSELLDRPVRYFAFPFGMKPNLSSAAAAMARADGIDCVVSAYGGYNFPGSDPFHLQRCHGDPELARLRNAITFDPRHMLRTKMRLETSGPRVAEALEFYRARTDSARSPSSEVDSTAVVAG